MSLYPSFMADYLRFLKKVFFAPLLLYSLLCVLSNTGNLLAQTISTQGIITDQSNGQILEGVNIVLTEIEGELRYGTASDRNGFYRIGSIQSGRYELNISYIGYITHRDTLYLTDGQHYSKSTALKPDNALLGEVLIAPEGAAARKEVGAQRITPEGVRKVPTPAAGGDLTSYLQAMPGVVTTGDRGGQLFIRGGTSTENMVLVDGLMIYQPFHIVGFFSPFAENLVRSADFYAGGFGPRYRGRISSVLDVQMKDGNRNEMSGSLSVSPFLGEVSAEGPIRQGKSSWIASYRNSLIEQTSPWLLGKEQPLAFDNQFLKVSNTGINSRCSAMMIRTYDRGRLGVEEESSIHWRNFVIGGKCMLMPQQQDYLVNMNMGISYNSNNLENENEANFSSDILRVHSGLNISRFSGSMQYNYGLFMHMKQLNYSLNELFQSLQDGTNTLFGTGVYLEADWPVTPRFKVKPGVSLSIYPGTYPASFEPRFRATWQPTDNENDELSAAVGLYRQPIAGISDMRDISSVFVAWMPSPEGESQKEAIHIQLGWQQSLGGGFYWSVEGYHKRLNNLPVSTWSSAAGFQTDLMMASGEVYGGDIRLEYNYGKLYGLIGYGYSWTMYKSAQDHFGTWFGDEVQTYHPSHDRRHQINSLFSVDVGNFSASVRWQLGSGLPFTQPIGFDSIIHFDGQLPNVGSHYGSPRIILDKPFQGRMPITHRLDVSLERTFQFSSGRISIQAGAINAYNQANLFYYDVYTQRSLNQLPFAPYVSFQLEKL